MFSNTATSVPAPKAQHNYVSKYPNHPINMGYGNNYPKYWQNERYNPADYPPLMVPRVPFYPAPYSQAWKPTAASAAQPVEVKVLEPYTPPHGFPSSKTPAKDAIDAYSQPQGVRKTTGTEPAMRKDLNFGEGSDGTSYTKIINNPGPSKKPQEEVNANGQPDWQKFSYGIVSDSLDHQPNSGAAVEADRGVERKTNAMGKVQSLIGGNGGGTWHEHLAKRNADSVWPEHIQAKAEKMMKSAAIMQDRGQSMMESDPAFQRQKAPIASPKAADAPEKAEIEKKEKEVGEKKEDKKGENEKEIPEGLMEMDASRKKVVPGSSAKGKSGGKEQKSQQKQPPAPKERLHEEEDPMMKSELPAQSVQTKKPKAPKSQRPTAGQEKSKPSRGVKGKKPCQGNAPPQSNGKKQPTGGKKPKKVDSLVKREAIPEPEAGALKGNNGSDKQAAPQKSGKDGEKEKPKGNAAARAQEKLGGGKRPNINQSRPKNPKNKNVAFEETIRQHFADDYVDEVIQEMCVVDDTEPTANLQKRQNRRILPCGPPVTIRRTLGAGDAFATPAAVPCVAPAVPYVAPIPTSAPCDVPVPTTASAVRYINEQAATQNAQGQIQVSGPLAIAPAAHVPQYAPQYIPQYVNLPAATQYVTVPGPTVTVDRAVPVAVAGPTEVVSVEHLIQRPVTRIETVVESVPYAVTKTQQVTFPVVTKTQMITKEIAYPVTRTMTQVQRETVYPEVYAIPREKEIIEEKKVASVVHVPATVNVVKHVPVTKTVLVCPACDQSEGACGCGTFDSYAPSGNHGGNGNGNGGNGDMDRVNVAMDMAMSMSHGNINGVDVNTHGNINGMDIKDVGNLNGDGTGGFKSHTGLAHGLEDVARTAEGMEAFVRKALPHEFAAAQ